MSQENIAQAVRALILGKHKVCGLTRTQDVKAAYQAMLNNLIYLRFSYMALKMHNL